MESLQPVGWQKRDEHPSQWRRAMKFENNATALLTRQSRQIIDERQAPDLGLEIATMRGDAARCGQD